MNATALLTYDKLESSQAWTPQQGPGIAKNIPDAARIVYEPDGIRLYTQASLEFAGWLAKYSLLLPAPLPSQFFASLSYELNPDDAVAQCVQAIETDSMVTMVDQRTGNCSGENDCAAGGQWQIVKAPPAGSTVYPWVNVGFAPGIPPADTWTPYLFNYAFDQIAGKSSVLGGVIAGAPFAVDASLQGVPFAKLGWSPNHYVVQLQTTMRKGGGACSVKFRNIKVCIWWNL